MSDKKKIILDKSLELFNREGYSVTTLRGIAGELGMSQGNLNYHFKTKGEIIESLYHDLVTKLDEKIQNFIVNAGLLGVLFESSVSTMTTMYEYRFFMRDFYTIMREYPGIRTSHIALQQRRKEEFSVFFNLLKQESIIRLEEFPDEYVGVYKRMSILGDNWINNLELLEQTSISEEVLKTHVLLLFGIIYPYLTEKGKGLWNQL
ncbi:TetR/AcrR family transcriptional regulator [bacterium]|nr:MAG: TetR/AcrR family transcriptional regulator [bacterium]